MDLRAHRIVALFRQSHWERVAKPKYLKAIDFTIGLIKRLTKEGKRLPGNSNAEVIKRLVEMRELAQAQGVNLSTVLENKQLLSGAGQGILRQLENDEARLLPAQNTLGPFVKDFPNKAEGTVKEQAAHMTSAIVSKLKFEGDRRALDEKLMTDEGFYKEAFHVVLPEINSARGTIVSALGGKIRGNFEERVKKIDSTFGKQGREGKPFIYFKDLVGCRTVVENVRQLAEGAYIAQSSFDVLDKKNYFLRGGNYNAINYNLGAGWLVFEFQLKTEVNAMEAALSHDLIYAKEKAIAHLSDEEKNLVATVIDVSTQLSMRDWGQAFDVAVKTARAAQR